MTTQEDVTGPRRVGDDDKRMGQQDMRPIQMRVVDVRASSLATEAHRQSAAVATSDDAEDDQAFIDALRLDD